jgi:uncharacterized membrane protein
VENPAGLLAVLLVVPAVIFWMTRHPTLGKIFKVVPALIFCYFMPTTLTTIGEQPAYILMGFIWMGIHIVVLLGVGLLIRAPVFLVAVGSQANTGRAASAPPPAAALHPSLAPVGAPLVVAGYVLKTYAGLVCMWMLKGVAGVGG